MSTYEIRICGFGGQGVILSGMIIGKAASLYEGKYSDLIQSFGPEARGSTSSAQVIISDDKIYYPYVTHSDILIAMSHKAYERFKTELKEDGILVYEKELVHPDNPPKKHYSIPATKLAEEHFGKTIFLNMVMVGFFSYVTGVVTFDSLKKAVKETVPPHTLENNIKALELGYNYAKSHYAR